MKNRQEYKQTEIGRIPTEWEVVRLGNVVELLKGKKPEQVIENSQEAYLPYLSTEYLRNNVEPKFAKHSNSTVLVNNGDLILLWDGSRAGEFFIGKLGLLSSTMVMMKIQEETIFQLFLFYLLKLKENYLSGQTRGTGIPHVDRNVFESLVLPLPPLPEQKKIAEVLSTVDEAIQKVDEIKEKTQRLKKGLMQELLTRGIGHKEFKETEIGRIPKEWKVVRLGDILALCQYGLSVKLSSEGEYPIIRMDEIEEGYVVPKITKYTDLDDKIFRTFKLEKGDILFNRTNSYELVGRTGIFLLEGDYVFASYLIRLRPKLDAADSSFLTFYLIHSSDRLRQLATRAVHQANINATNLRKFRFLLPPLTEQKKIAEILSTVDERIQRLGRKKEKLDRVKKGLMQDLLTGRKRVKI